MAAPGARTAAWSLCAALGASLAVTAFVVVRDVQLAPSGGSGQVALDSVAATIGLSLSYLLYGRFRAGRELRDLLLCLSLLLLGGGNAVLSVLPVLLGEQKARLTSAGILVGLSAGLLFAAAVLIPRWRVPPLRPLGDALLLAAPAAVVLATLSLLSSTQPGTGAADSFGGTRDVLVTAAQATAALAFLVAAVAWSRPAARADRVAAPLAAAAVFGAASRVDFALADRPTSALVTAGTLLRVLFYAALVATAVLEVRTYWRRVSDAAVLEERRRLARELHDGLAQELAFIVTQARGLREQSTNRRAQLIVRSAERALDESRRAIAALTRALDEPLEVALGQTVEEVAGRFDTRVRLELTGGLQVSGEKRETLLRVAREAVANASRHGEARNVVVSLDNGDGLRLRVTDDGAGFDPAAVDLASGSFGLTSMRERAEALGGTFHVTSAAERGTTVEVRLP